MSAASINPILVEVVRGNDVESFHRGAACVVDTKGAVVRRWGDIKHPICPRSAIKPFQALPLIESGAAAAFRVSSEEIALACASHSGEPDHVERVSAWLKRMDLAIADLECGTHAPTNGAAEAALIRAGKEPCALHHNCSGKHTGFLALARHLNAPTRGYTAPDHPVQRAAVRALADMAGCVADSLPVVRDGCSAANVYLPLEALARAWAQLGATTNPAAERIVRAMKAHPVLMSGHGRPCAILIGALAGRGIVKTGAEGVYAAALPERGLGIAVKIDDGAGRAATVAITAILKSLGAFMPESAGAIEKLRVPVQTAIAGGVTGVIRPAQSWLT